MIGTLRGRTRLAFASLMFAAAGCATLEPNEWELRFKSEPSGAMVYSAKSGKAIGITPMERSLFLNPTQQALVSMEDEVLVVWPSGASLRQRITFWPARNRIWNWTFSRPSNAPNLDIDLRQAALQTQYSRADADPSALLLTAFVSAYNAGRLQTAVPYSFTPPSVVRCRTRAVGWAAVTDCQ